MTITKRTINTRKKERQKETKKQRKKRNKDHP